MHKEIAEDLARGRGASGSDATGCRLATRPGGLTLRAATRVLLAAGLLGSVAAHAAEQWWKDPLKLEQLITPQPESLWVGDRLPGAPKQAVEIPNPERPLTLAELTDLGLRNNPQTRAAWQAARAAAAQVGIELADYSLQASGLLSYTRARQINQTGTLQPLIVRTSPTVNLTYALFDFGVRSNQVEAARFNLLAANLSQNRALQTVAFNVEQAYYAFLASQALVTSGRISLRNSETILESTERRRQSGLATIGDVYRAETAVAQTRLALQQAQGQTEQARGRLSFAAGLPIAAPFTLAPTPETLESGSLTESVASLIERAKSGRPDLIAAEASARALSATSRATAAAGLPSVVATGTYATNYFVDRPNSPNWALGFAVNVPIFSGFRDTYNTRLAEANADRQRATRDLLSNQVELDVWQGYFNLQTAAAALVTAQSLIRTASQSLEVAEARYRGGVGSLLEVITAQVDDVNARVQQITAQGSWYAAFSQLNYALGSLPLRTNAATAQPDGVPAATVPSSTYTPSLPVQK